MVTSIPWDIKKRIDSLSEQEFEEFIESLNIAFDKSFTKKEKMNLLKAQKPNRLKKALKEINPKIFKSNPSKTEVN